MEKKEVRIKCTGCQAAYKLRVPAMDKPLAFKCPKCGKSLKLMIKSTPAKPPAAPSPEAMPSGLIPGFESTRVSDAADGQAGSGPPTDQKALEFLDQQFGVESPGQQVSSSGRTGMWIVLAADKIKGPFTSEQIRGMIGKGEITADTSIRRGERPWVSAGKVPNFAALFKGESLPPRLAALDSMRLVEPEAIRANDQYDAPTKNFVENLSAIVPYPVQEGARQPLAIFAGIAFVLSAALCIDFILGLLINLLGWLILYGYLDALMIESMEEPTSPPPAWNFAAAQEMVMRGAKVFAVLLAFSLVPVAIVLTLTITFFLNGMSGLGLLFILLTMVVFVASLFVVPASLVALASTGDLGRALNPSGIVEVVKKGGRPYMTLAAFSVVTGLACMVVTIMSVFLVEIPLAGLVVSGLLMALVFSYGHFLWFHLLGRFAGQNMSRPGALATAARA